MEIDSQGSPGTVSKILWHFTGGPKWNAIKKTQGSSAKPAAEAYKSLRAIIRTKQIRLGNYQEVVKANVLVKETKGKKVSIVERKRTIVSSPICCLSDIPAPHLRYHSQRYGKFAIGFHRAAVIEAGFNPVLYALEDANIIRQMYWGWAGLSAASLEDALSAVQMAELELMEIDAEVSMDGIQQDLEFVQQKLKRIHSTFENFLAMTKTFSKEEFSSIYCEREWRSTEPFDFEFEHVAMIVLPREVSGRAYYRPFVESSDDLKVPRTIPIVPWDDLVEH